MVLVSGKLSFMAGKKQQTELHRRKRT